MSVELDRENTENWKELKKTRYIDTLAFMNSWHDLQYEYGGENELKMLRSCYIFHALNTVLRQNETILANDQIGKFSYILLFINFANLHIFRQREER